MDAQIGTVGFALAYLLTSVAVAVVYLFARSFTFSPAGSPKGWIEVALVLIAVREFARGTKGLNCSSHG